MYTSKTLALVALSLFGGSASAHMVMAKPVPYSAVKVQSSPLDGSTYAFPCQGGTKASYYEGSESTSIQAGGSTELSFTGSAVHGGGSCQVSITYEDPPPADQSKWKVIHSMIGGCPAKAAGNIQTSGTDSDGRPTGDQCSGGSDTDCVKTYEVTIPKELKSGNATFAWTWFNKIGNREMYMNCAPIQITGGSDSDDYYNSLPDMFVANIPGKCTTGNGVLQFPNPGTSVENGDTVDKAAIGACDSGLNAGSGSGSGSSGSSSAAAGGSTPVSTPVAGGSTPVSTPAAGGVFAPGASSAASYTATSLATVVVTQSSAAAGGAAATPVATPATPAGGASSAAGTGSANCTPCSNSGEVVCIGDSQFGLCNNGCAVAQALAAGTTCSNGTISKRDTGAVFKGSHAKAHARAKARAAGAIHRSS